MAFSRMDRITHEVKKEISEILRDIKDPRITAMMSVVAVNVTKDLRFAKVFVSVLGNSEEQKEALAALKSAAGFVRRELSRKIDLRYTPEIIFTLDNSIEHGIHISKLINDTLNTRGEDDERNN